MARVRRTAQGRKRTWEELSVTELAQTLLAHGIRPRSFDVGDQKMRCPKCSHTRKNKSDPCLSLTIDSESGGVWHCHNCGWSGNVPSRRPSFAPAPRRTRKPEPPTKPTGDGLQPLPANAVQWFASRGISDATLARYGIAWGQKWIPAASAEVGAIAFPYRRGGELTNIKWRAQGKHFAQEKGAEKIFYGVDDVTGDECIIVEGEIDKLSLAEVGIFNVLSVPDGAPKIVKEQTPNPDDDAKFSYVWNCRDVLDRCKRVILAVDNDGPGQALEEELARRIGKEKCWRVTWPDSNDVACKDANDVLLAHGAEVLAECIREARPYPLESLHEWSEFRGEIYALYHGQRSRAFPTGWDAVDAIYRVREGSLTVVTGYPGSGKSEFIDALMMNLSRQFGWRHGVCSFENPPDDHFAKLAEKYTGKPFFDGPTPRMSETEVETALSWISEHFYAIRFDKEAPTIDNILENARAAVMRYGIRGLGIDPYNEIEHRRPANMTETEFVSQVLGKVKRFAEAHGVHVWFIAHPAKPAREGGKLPVPTFYDVAGSAHWVNKADFGLVVHREREKQPPETEIYVRKSRYKAVATEGMATLRYDKVTGRYSDPPPPAPPRWAADR